MIWATNSWQAVLFPEKTRAVFLKGEDIGGWTFLK